MTSTRVWIAAFGALGLWACSGGDPSPEPGQIGWPCPNDNNCARSLTCIEGACAEGARDGGSPPDAAVDAGVATDAAPPDAEPVDAGEPDTGMPEDAGQPDAGCEIPATLTAIASEVFGADRTPRCNQAACHGEQAAGGIRLTPPLADLHATLLGPTRDPQAPERNLVVPNDPEDSRLYVIMRDRNPAGQGGPMPPDAPVPFCELEAVRQWILAGAAND